MSSRLSAEADSAAVALVLDTGKGGMNAHIMERLSPSEIYESVNAAQSLEFEKDGQHFSLQYPYPMLDEAIVVGLIEDAHDQFWRTLMLSHSATERVLEAAQPGITVSAIADVDMTDLVEYESAESVPEWQWVEAHGIYAHR